MNAINVDVIAELSQAIDIVSADDSVKVVIITGKGERSFCGQAQDMLKYHLKKGTLFTLRDTRPQQYFPSIMRSEIIKNELDKNTSIDPTEVTYSASLPSSKLLDNLTSTPPSVVSPTTEQYGLL